MKLLFHPQAEQEFVEAVDYYESQRNGLGIDFATDVAATLDRILQFPSAWPEIESRIRRILLKRFPFGLLYYNSNESIIILATMNLNREPTYWKSRIK